jgi:hypothetical protein
MAELENARNENFAKYMAQGMSQRQAYKAAFPSANRWKDETIDNKASALYRTNEISARIAEIQKAATSETVMSITERKETLSEVARDKKEKTKDRLSAIDILNKMDNAYEQNININGNVNNPFEGLSTEELKAIVSKE